VCILRCGGGPLRAGSAGRILHQCLCEGEGESAYVHGRAGGQGCGGPPHDCYGEGRPAGACGRTRGPTLAKAGSGGMARARRQSSTAGASASDGPAMQGAGSAAAAAAATAALPAGCLCRRLLRCRAARPRAEQVGAGVGPRATGRRCSCMCGDVEGGGVEGGGKAPREIGFRPVGVAERPTERAQRHRTHGLARAAGGLARGLRLQALPRGAGQRRGGRPR
jgi:hypothetical protein